jgi:hypothetical protein
MGGGARIIVLQAAAVGFAGTANLIQINEFSALRTLAHAMAGRSNTSD